MHIIDSYIAVLDFTFKGELESLAGGGLRKYRKCAGKYSCL